MAPRPRYPMPDFIRNALNQRGRMDAYLSRPSYQQNDYIGWIQHAKREDTKSSVRPRKAIGGSGNGWGGHLS
ncbi:MAG TPA: hypothetical protein VJ785_00735 [Anaerolineales bacterium]|nr:hypothetical protein [Anaerolineales bacterium]